MTRILYPRRSETAKLRSTALSWVHVFLFVTVTLIFVVFFFSRLWLTQLFFSAVIGQEELDAHSVNVRNCDDISTKAKGEMVALDAMVQLWPIFICRLICFELFIGQVH